MTALLAALGIAGLALLFDGLRARERVLDHCRRACAELSVQLLDETVAVTRIDLARDLHGRWRLRRVYRFEFSVDGTDRRSGLAVLTGGLLSHIRLDHPAGPVVLPAGDTPRQALH
jgi:hypothetical protein